MTPDTGPEHREQHDNPFRRIVANLRTLRRLILEQHVEREEGLPVGIASDGRPPT